MTDILYQDNPIGHLRTNTSKIERLLVFLSLAILPFQSYFPQIGGFSISFISFIVLILFQICKNTSLIFKVLNHKIVLCGIAFVLVGYLMEMLHDSMQYYYVFRIGLMFFGALTIGLYCRDRKSLQMCIYGILVGSLVVSVVLFLTVYNVLNTAQAENFKQVNKVRAEAFAENTLESDLNKMGFQAGQGALIALALMLTARSKIKFLIFLGIGGFCIISSFLPISRGAIAIIFVSAGVVCYTYGLLKTRMIAIASLLFLCIAFFVPDVVFLRFVVNTEKVDGKYSEGRTRVYNAAVEELSDYILVGVGIKEYYGDWGRRSSFAKRSGAISGAHNCFVQIAVFWGLPGLILLILIVYQSYRYFPKISRFDPLYLALLGIAISTLLETMVVHTIEGKEFSIILGLIVGSSIWVWKRNNKRSAMVSLSVDEKSTQSVSF